MTRVLTAATVIVLLVAGGQAQPARIDVRELDELLDLNVRDGRVYYRALKATRAPLDRFVQSLAAADVERDSPDGQMAFWLNAYNAIVLKTVIDHYPMAAAANFPGHSIRQIAGAFDRTGHRIAGRNVTLDQIEQTILPAFRDARLFLALGRGALGSGRLRSEAYTPEQLQRQLADVAAECATRGSCVQISRLDNKLKVSGIFSWRQKEFIDGYASHAPNLFSARSPIERAVLAFIEPALYQAEHDFLNQNQFTLEYLPFDWTLNDLTQSR